MPIPEDIMVYGRNDLLQAVAHRQPAAGAVPAFPNQARDCTRTVTLHTSDGWWYRGWRTDGTYWYGTVYNIDLDGTLYQCTEMNRRTLHVGGGPHFTGANSFANDTSIGIEICRFAYFIQQNANFRPLSYNIPFQLDTNNTEICNYSTGSKHSTGTNCQFNLHKMPGGQAYQQSTNRPWYFVKAADFNDNRNPETAVATMDILYTEEQYHTLILWVKAMCEMFRIPKYFFHDPTRGQENPWIDTEVLVRNSEPVAIRNEAIQRARTHQGIMGHMNLQNNRSDPCASLDYYRLKRGISDKWWYPVNLDDTERAMNYLDQARSANYLALTDYGDLDSLESYFQASENADVGFYPVGANRIWHGGIHLPSGNNSRPVYSMANGTIIAARVINQAPNATTVLPFSRCFVLIKHPVHTANTGNEINYGATSTSIIYSLYMHLCPLVIQRDAAGDFVLDYNNLPVWVNHYLIDHPTDTNITNGEIIIPDQPVILGDFIGKTGNYIVSVQQHRGRQQPRYGNTLHLELFTLENPQNFPRSPWNNVNNRIEDPSQNDVVCDLSLLDNWIRDAAQDGIDVVDIRNATTSLREKTVRHKSEWSIQTRQELSREITTTAGRIQIGEVLSEQDFQTYIVPMSFHQDMVSHASATQDIIGPFFSDTSVWHLHPFAFLHWMNRRVLRHEQIMAEQDKSTNPLTSNITVQSSYVTGFQNLAGGGNQLPQNTGATAYPNAIYNDNNYDVTLDGLCDQAALKQVPQNNTRFHLGLLEALDMLNDSPRGIDVVEGYVSTGNPITCGRIAGHQAHHNGDAVDVRPSNITLQNWYTLYEDAKMVACYIGQAHDVNCSCRITYDTPTSGAGTPTYIELETSCQQLEQTLTNAANAGDPILATTVINHLNMLRLHFYTGYEFQPERAAVSNARWLSREGHTLDGVDLNIQPGSRVRLDVDILGIANGATVAFIILGRRYGSARRAINNQSDLQQIHGNLTFPLNNMERDQTGNGVEDQYIARVDKQLSGVDETDRGQQLTVEFIFPREIPRGISSCYFVALVPSSSNTLTGNTTTEHLVTVSSQDLRYPTVCDVFWSSTPNGNTRVSVIQDNEPIWIVIETANLPRNCRAIIEIRDRRDATSQSRAEINLQQGNSRAIHSWRTPDIPWLADLFGRDDAYHCSVRIVSRTRGSWEIIWGSSWLDVQ